MILPGKARRPACRIAGDAEIGAYLPSRVICSLSWFDVSLGSHSQGRF